MEKLNAFLTAIEHDPRIGVSHISVYCTLLGFAASQQQDPILFRSAEVMKAAKISGVGTYYKCIRDLHDQGYLKYVPCYNHRKKNRVYLTP